MNPFELLKNLNIEDLKKKSQEALGQLKEIEATGESGGGFVKITINGEFNILSIEYEENDIIKDDLTTFKDLIISAHNDAVSKMRTEIQKKFSNSIIPGFSL
jgi:DNA-binding YbaB/EbfC family protein